VWRLEKPLSARCTVKVHVCRSPDCSTALSTYSLRVKWLDDPKLARIDRVNVTVAEKTATVCAYDAKDFKPEQCASEARIYPGRNSTSGACSIALCTPHSVLTAGVEYRRGERIRITVRPYPSGRLGWVSIGQRIIQMSSLGEGQETFQEVQVSFSLFDSADRLSPFVPFFIRQRSRNRMLLDVPITVTLEDGITSAPLILTLDVDLKLIGRKTPPPPLLKAIAPAASSRDLMPSKATAPAGAAVVDVPPPYGVVMESTRVQVVASPPSRRLQEISSSAPGDQPWISNPLDNTACSACQAGTFSYRYSPCSIPLFRSRAYEGGGRDVVVWIDHDAAHPRVHEITSCFFVSEWEPVKSDARLRALR
jgi:hypothetical protein